LVLPSIVATPFCTETVKCSTLIFDFPNFARIVRSIRASGTFDAPATGLITDVAWLSPEKTTAKASAEISFLTLFKAYTINAASAIAPAD
jgi:hypothetical protein